MFENFQHFPLNLLTILPNGATMNIDEQMFGIHKNAGVARCGAAQSTRGVKREQAFVTAGRRVDRRGLPFL